ncbi:transcriptional regulator family: Fungal Specific TF, partial [Penicillium argentinense]
MSRPQVSIDRLTPRRATVEPREAMNCKSCRKRKIKCNRLRPSCEACKVFQCPCVYDAVPKKRGPKTDVLEALLKRVDGLEKRLQDEKNPISPTSPDATPDELPAQPPVGQNGRRNTINASSFNFNSSDARPALSTSMSQTADSSQRPESFQKPTGPAQSLP